MQNLKTFEQFINEDNSEITEKVKEIEIGKTYTVSKNFRSGSNSIDKGYEIEILDIGNNFAEIEVFDGPSGMGTKMEVEISDLEKYLVESEINERRKPITKKHWDKADDDQKEEWLLQAFSDPDDAMEYVETDWEDLPPVATSNMYESFYK